MDIIYCYSVMFYRFFSFFIDYACFRNKFCPISRVVIFFFIIEYNSFYSKCFIRQNRLTNKQETIMKTQLNIVDESLGKINFPKKFFLKKLIRRHSKRDGRQILQKKKKKKKEKNAANKIYNSKNKRCKCQAGYRNKNRKRNPGIGFLLSE